MRYKLSLVLAWIITLTVLVCLIAVPLVGWVRRLVSGEMMLTTCSSYIMVRGWLDADQDGHWDEDEAPIDGVMYVSTAAGNGDTRLVSDSDGEVTFLFFIPCDPQRNLQTVSIHPVLPAHMVLTFQPEVDEIDMNSPPRLLLFGFAYAEANGP